MKKFLTLFAIIATMLVTPMLSSCGGDDDEPDYKPEHPDTPGDPDEEDEFDDIVGYWLNADKSGAMEIVKTTSSYCTVKYYVYTTDGVESCSSNYYGGNSSFQVLTPTDCEKFPVIISTSSASKIFLEKSGGYSWQKLTSYLFNRVKESEFYSYIGNGGNGGNQGSGDDAGKLLGTWKGKDGSETYTITFYSSGKAIEEWSDGYDSERLVGTYKYSDGTITEWNFEDGSILMNVLNECPWKVTFKSATSMTLKSVYSTGSMTFTKQ